LDDKVLDDKVLDDKVLDDKVGSTDESGILKELEGSGFT
jgi:hypothetical protein